jgi:4-amino-4-deoxy-L-arabinose transferase-like glycosyltransferase
MRARIDSTFAAVALLTAVFLILNSYLLIGGVQVSGDSGRYIRGAESLLRGQQLTAHQSTFLGYIFVVALCRYLGAGLSGVVILQILFSALAALALYDLGKNLCGHASGLLATALFVCNPDIMRWNGYVLTESLYTSAVVLAIWAVYHAARRGRYWYLFAGLVVCFAASIRPHGWPLLPIAAVYWIVTAPVRARTKYSLAAALLVCAFVLLFAAPALYKGVRGNLEAATGQEGASQENLERIISRGVVVWGYDGWNLTMPPAHAAEGEPSALSYVAAHPAASARLASTRVITELIHVRPFYSARHNALVLIYVVILYAFAAAGLVYRAGEPLCWLTASIIAAQLLFVALTWADWDGRFLIHVLPQVGLLGACGVAHSYKLLRPKIRFIRPSSSS